MASIIQRKRSYCVVYLYDDEDGSSAPETGPADTVAATGLDAETLTKILNNPELATLLKTLADKL